MPASELSEKVSHTPGPWTVLENGHVYDIVEHHTLPTHPVGVKLAQVYNAGPDDLANARLIAASPELLEALTDIAAQLGGLEGRAYKWIRERAIAAIAKATGQDKSRASDSAL